MQTADLFADVRRSVTFASDAILHPGFALPHEAALLDALRAVLAAAPLRTWQTPGGHCMSATKSNCGEYGWVSDRKGYRYTTHDPDSGELWPAMPAIFTQVAGAAAHASGFPNFHADGCLINGYERGAKLSLHQDSDEKDVAAPVVAISLGLPATFIFGGITRAAPTVKVPLQHGDVVCWGGASRLAFHGIAPLKAGSHPTLGSIRISLTFRKAR